MAYKIIKKLFGYELCIFEKEGTLYSADNVVIIRKEGFTEIFNLDSMCHETGDTISRASVRNTIYKYIEDNRNDFLN